jgi:hypothetical protein
MSVYKTAIELDNVDGCETEITVHYNAVNAYKGATDGLYGLKIEPDEPAHIEIESVTGPDGKSIELTTAQENSLIEAIGEDEYDRWLSQKEQD